MFALNRFFNFLYPRKSVLVTNNEPLTRLFCHNCAFRKMTSARRLRYASLLTGSFCTVKCLTGNDNSIMDYLSRVQYPRYFECRYQRGSRSVMPRFSFTCKNYHVIAITIAAEISKDTESPKSTSQDSPYTSQLCLSVSIQLF